MLIEGILEKVPYFNAPIYLENKTQIGKVRCDLFVCYMPTLSLYADSFLACRPSHARLPQ